MQAIDLKDLLSDIILDTNRSIPKAHLNSVCKIYQGKSTCRYIALGMEGFVCCKHSKAESMMDGLVQENKIVAQGNNCEGLRKSDQT